MYMVGIEQQDKVVAFRRAGSENVMSVRWRGDTILLHW